MLNESQKKIFWEQGYLLLENFFSEEEIQPLTEICNELHEKKQVELKKTGPEGINHLNRTFLANQIDHDATIKNFVLGDKMVNIVKCILEEKVYLFLEQFVVKNPKSGGAFAWHQDSGYIEHDHPVYLSCWLALDDVSTENGTVYMRDIKETGGLGTMKHGLNDDNDMTCDIGENQGTPIVAPKGSLAIFTSRTFHRSGENKSDGFRRAYLMQFSPEPLMSKDGKEFINRAILV